LGPKWMVFGDQRIAFGNSAGGYGEARLLIRTDSLSICSTEKRVGHKTHELVIFFVAFGNRCS